MGGPNWTTYFESLPCLFSNILYFLLEMRQQISPVLQLDHLADFLALTFLPDFKSGVSALVYLDNKIWQFAVVGPPVMQLVPICH